MKKVEYILTGKEMQLYDKNTIERLKVPSLVLMEQAALAALEEIQKEMIVSNKKILILSGTGNNGGDALALARLLFLKDALITVVMVSNRQKEELSFSSEAETQYEIIKKMGIPVVTELPSDSYDMIIDGIFGVGLNREITGKIREIISKVNTYGGKKIALDLPSGIDASTGQIYGVAFQAHITITFAFYKRGLCFFPGRETCGRIIKKEIGITEYSFFEEKPEMYALKGEPWNLLPLRSSFGHKGTFGKILIVAGSKSIGGAAYLSAKAAFYSGCGMVKICTHKNQYGPLFSLLPEAMYECYENEGEISSLMKEAVSWADIIVMGPGMGTDALSQKVWQSVIEGEKKPLVLDADGLTLLAKEENTALLEKLQKEEKSKRTLVLTPHALEFARLCNLSMVEVEKNWEKILREYAHKLKCIIVKKNARTVICDGGKELTLNLTGNHGMATAGSGDVLCGIIAAFLAVFSDSSMAVKTAVYCHGLAGDLMVEKRGHHSLMAGDLLEAIPLLLSKGEKKREF